MLRNPLAAGVNRQAGLAHLFSNTTEADMATNAQRGGRGGTPKWKRWTGGILSAIPVLALLMAATFSFQHGPQVVEGMAKFGYQEGLVNLVAVLATVSAVLYVIPRTAVLGALFMTAYFGAAVATHLRVGDPGYPLAIIMAIFTWGGLWLRDARIRELLPLRRTA